MTPLEKALRKALEGRAGPEEWTLICTDAACRAGLDSATIEDMTASLETDALQRRLDGLLPESEPASDVVYDTLPEGLIDLPTACRQYGVNRQTANGWLRRGLVRRAGKLKAPGDGGVNVVEISDFEAMASKPRSVGGRPKKT